MLSSTLSLQLYHEKRRNAGAIYTYMAFAVGTIKTSLAEFVASSRRTSSLWILIYMTCALFPLSDKQQIQGLAAVIELPQN
jgi:hypothetical protein